jgi:hypothetical protein
MTGLRACPSAKALVEVILAKDPSWREGVEALVNAHTAYVGVLMLLPQGRDVSVARTEAETSFAWALKALGDQVLRD